MNVSAISISTCFDYSVQLDVQLGMIREAGFRYVSFGRNFEHSGILDAGSLKAVKSALSQNRLSVDTIHGYEMDKPDSLEVNRAVVRAAATLEAPVVALHCSAFTFDLATLADKRRDVREKLKQYESLARESGVRFAFENVLPGIATDFMEEMLREADPDYFGFCYDSSHDQIDGPRDFSLLERLSGRLIAVHLSDRIREFVDHVLPGGGFIDFTALCGILAKAKIGFPLMMEVMTAHSSIKDPEVFLRAAKEAAADLERRIRS